MKITLPIPSRLLSPNARCHWSRRAKVFKAAKAVATMETKAAMSASGYEFPLPKAAYKAVWFFKDRRDRDPDNFMGSLKAYIDGMAAAGLVQNDKVLWPERPEVGEPDKHNPRVEITIIPEL
jgi:Holliday junction resolvase RusA-like endonuclease